jgi:hypothetical protein
MIQVNVQQHKAKVNVIKKLVTDAIKAKYPEAEVSVVRVKPATSRADRFSEAQSEVSGAKSTAEELFARRIHRRM